VIDPDDFARRQMELAAEFAKFIMEHPEIDESLPEDSYVYFEIEGESEFNRYSRELAQRREREEGMIPVCVRAKGLAAPQGSRLIDPRIATPSDVA